MQDDQIERVKIILRIDQLTLMVREVEHQINILKSSWLRIFKRSQIKVLESVTSYLKFEITVFKNCLGSMKDINND